MNTDDHTIPLGTALARWAERIEAHVPADQRPSIDDADSICDDTAANAVCVITTDGTSWLATDDACSAFIELGSLTSFTVWTAGGVVHTETGDSEDEQEH